MGNIFEGLQPFGNCEAVSLNTDSQGWARKEVLSASYDVAMSYTAAGATQPSTATVKATPVGATATNIEIKAG